MHSEKDRRLRRVMLSIGGAAMLIFPGVTAQSFQASPSNANPYWAHTWGASPEGSPNTIFFNQTVRLIVHTSIGGDRVRVRLANTFGDRPLVIGAAHIAIRSAGAAIKPESDRVLTFSGAPSITIPIGAPVMSDPIQLDVPALSDLAVSLFIPVNSGIATMHATAVQTSYISSTGDFSATPEAAPFTSSATSWFFLSGVEVRTSEATRTIVAFGDSITDGTNSTLNANSRWPDELIRRLRADQQIVGLLNEGIGGNKIIHDFPPGRPGFGVNAMARFERDVLAQPGVSHVIILEGINDIGQPLTLYLPEQEVTSDEIIAGLEQLIDRAHARGIKTIGGTLTPVEGNGYFSPDTEMKRQAVNNWIRTGGAYDGVIDFDAAVRDPDRITRFLPAFDSGDHLHPNDAGYKAMANAIDLTLFR